MTGVTVQQVTKRFGSLTALDNVSFHVRAGEVVSIIGPSGAGKTTLLKILAGLEDANEGTIRFTEDVHGPNPAILVFQDYVLFPHMNVYNNVAYGLKTRKVPKNEVRDRVMVLLRDFGIDDKAQVYPAQLSGGQRQRVALARALVVNPSLLLLDEPFANLDKNLKAGTAEFLRSTIKKYGTTAVAVTHDLEEAFQMSDCIGLLQEGVMVQYDTVEKIYFHPANFQAASFLGPVNRIPQQLYPLLGITEKGLPPEVFTRAEGLRLHSSSGGAGEVVSVSFKGTIIQYRVEIEGTELTIFGVSDSFVPGERVSVECVHYFTDPSKR